MEEYKVIEKSHGGYAAAALAAGFLVLVGGGALLLTRRPDDSCTRYLDAKSQGALEASVACNAKAIENVSCQLSQMQQNALIKESVNNAACSVTNAANLNQAKTDAGLAAVAVQNGITNEMLQSIAGNRFVYAKNICDSCPKTTTASA